MKSLYWSSSPSNARGDFELKMIYLRIVDYDTVIGKILIRKLFNVCIDSSHYIIIKGENTASHKKI